MIEIEDWVQAAWVRRGGPEIHPMMPQHRKGTCIIDGYMQSWCCHGRRVGGSPSLGDVRCPECEAGTCEWVNL